MAKNKTKTEYKSYREKLRDPRWQKLRLHVMNRDDFTCRECGGKEKTLNVHHRYYTKGKSPWEYPDDALVTLCEDCHVEIERMRDYVTKEAGIYGWEELFQICSSRNYLSGKYLESGGYLVILFADFLKGLEVPDCLVSVDELHQSLAASAFNFTALVTALSAHEGRSANAKRQAYINSNKSEGGVE